MASVHDVAKYIIEKQGNMSAMKMQKLVYYAQAWSLVWDEVALFSESIHAWANGPVVPELYEAHRGQFSISGWPLGDPENINEDGKETIDVVLGYYGKLNPQQLSDLTHHERPWRDARHGIPDGERGSAVISLEAMSEYYSSIQPNE